MSELLPNRNAKKPAAVPASSPSTSIGSPLHPRPYASAPFLGKRLRVHRIGQSKQLAGFDPKATGYSTAPICFAIMFASRRDHGQAS